MAVPSLYPRVSSEADGADLKTLNSFLLTDPAHIFGFLASQCREFCHKNAIYQVHSPPDEKARLSLFPLVASHQIWELTGQGQSKPSRVLRHSPAGPTGPGLSEWGEARVFSLKEPSVPLRPLAFRKLSSSPDPLLLAAGSDV